VTWRFCVVDVVVVINATAAAAAVAAAIGDSTFSRGESTTSLTTTAPDFAALKTSVPCYVEVFMYTSTNAKK